MRVSCVKKTTSIFLFIVLVGIFISSCSESSTEDSISVTFAEIDSLIELQEFSSAEKLLKKTTKKITNPVETIGIIKRLFILQEDSYAKGYIEDSLDIFPDNVELQALYSYVLMEDEEYENALPYAKNLENTKYGSIYSELRFLVDSLDVEDYNNSRDADDREIFIDFISPYYVQAYADIYNSTENEDYLKNVALVYALQGDLQTAFSYHPRVLSAYDDSYFWSLISYDSYNFEQALQDLQINTLSKDEIELLADSYLRCNDIENAYTVWAHTKDVFGTASPLSYHNIAVHSHFLGNQKVTNELVLEMVNDLPYFADGLSLYCELARLQTIPVADSSPFSRQLEAKGLYSLAMAEANAVPVLDIVSASTLLQNSVSHVASLGEDELAKLLVEITMNSWQTSKNMPSASQKVADIWLLLENNQKEGLVYNPVLVQFATWCFLAQDMVIEADALFTDHCTSYYADYFSDKTEYSKTPLPNMQSWEYETGAYIAFVQERYTDALEWFHALIPNTILHSTIPLGTALNIAQLEDLLGRRNTAISLYEQILDYETDKKNRSEVYYRAGVIFYEIGDVKKAVFSFEESLRENPAHNGAQVYLKKIKL